ncbi:MAG: TonB-dependent receptor [Bacteroidia bacterium]|nr:TonB-dependent receptor [Bacteroidia bacterium]
MPENYGGIFKPSRISKIALKKDQFMRITTVLLGCFLCCLSSMYAQSNGERISLTEGLKKLEKQFGVSLYYDAEFLPKREVNMPDAAETIESSLDAVLKNTGLSFINYRDYAFIIAPVDQIDRKYNRQYFAERDSIKESIARFKEEVEAFSVGTAGATETGGSYTIEGFITDDASDEFLVGASISVEGTGKGAISNEIGKFKLSLTSGDYVLLMKSMGYVDSRIKLTVLGSGNLDLNLSKEAIQLDEIVISSEAQNSNVSSTDVGREVLSVKEMKRLPAFMGEADVIKTLLLLPGVSSVGEGAGGLNVRGGNVDQNLVMQDGMYLFNTSHVLGLFSLFNPDVVNKVDLYKGSMPARYGGRLSSILDVELKEGNYQKFTGKGGLGLVSSRLTLETPIQKGKSSIIVGSRFSISDYLFDVIEIAEIQESSAFFYDTNAKFTQRFGDKGKLSLSGYYSQDRFKFDQEFDFRWKTRGVNANFNYLFSNTFSFNLEAVYSLYESSWTEENSNRAFLLENGINYLKVRPEINLSIGDLHNLNAGIEFNNYEVDPGAISPLNASSTTIAKDVPDEQGRDIALYLNDEFALTDQLSLNLGLRYVYYQSLGPGEVSLYAEGVARLPEAEIGTVNYGDGELITSYSGLEPRASLRFSFDETASIKMSYNRTQQFINQLSNTTAVSPVDIWQLSNTYIEPLRANNYSFGFFKNFISNTWESSLEVFFRDIDNLIEYRDLANLLVNDQLETEILSGIGRSYGAEFSLRKNKGRLTGWLGYTYSRTERKTEGEFIEESINNNEWFLSNYDRPHDISFVLTFQANKKNHFGLNFVYSSGRPITAPAASFSVGNALNVPIYSERNSIRIPAYHRLDFSYTVGQSHKKEQLWRSSWTFGVFNVYGRRNPFTVFFTQDAAAPPQANRLSVLGSIIPSITYNFSF